MQQCIASLLGVKKLHSSFISFYLANCAEPIASKVDSYFTSFFCLFACMYFSFQVFSDISCASSPPFVTLIMGLRFIM